MSPKKTNVPPDKLELYRRLLESTPGVAESEIRSTLGITLPIDHQEAGFRHVDNLGLS
jgi:hypothetical protein